MKFLFTSTSHFNLANLVTFANIAAGLIATYCISQGNFFWAIIFAWFGGAFDIIDGKLARKYALSNEFGIQLDSFADFLSFVLVPVFLIFQAIYTVSYDGVALLVAGFVSIYYVISGLRRLISFNLNADAGEVAKFFTGVPTPLGAILLWITLLTFNASLFSPSMVMVLMIVIGWSLNSRMKIPHP